MRLLIDPFSFQRAGYEIDTNPDGTLRAQYRAFENFVLVETILHEHPGTQHRCRLHVQVYGPGDDPLQDITVNIAGPGHLLLPLKNITPDWATIVIVCERTAEWRVVA